MQIDGKKQHRLKVNGKFNFSSLKPEVKKAVMNRLSDKDGVMAQGKAGILPGIKIDGKQITKDNIKDFEKKPSAKKVVKKTLSYEKLHSMNKSEQVDLLEKLGAKTIPRYEKDRIDLILKLQ